MMHKGSKKLPGAGMHKMPNGMMMSQKEMAAMMSGAKDGPPAKTKGKKKAPAKRPDSK